MFSPDIKLEVSLTILLSSDRDVKPAGWNWEEILDLLPGETVEVRKHAARPYEPSLPDALPSFDGETYQPEFDESRLSVQMRRVYDAMRDGLWHTLGELSELTATPEASLSARIRDFRKPKFGGFVVDRKRGGNGLHYYRLKIPQNSMK
jgi:hypothetical protein